MLEDWVQTLPSTWSYKSYRSLRNHGELISGEYEAQFDVYQDPWIACLWNSYRNVRLLIHESIIVATLKYGTLHEKSRLEHSTQVLEEMANEVSHSTIYHLGRSHWDGGVSRSAKDLSSVDNTSMPGGYLLVWPLFFSAMLRTSSKEQRQWVAKIFHQVGTQMGLRLAISMAERLEEKELSFSDNETFFFGEWYPN
jgi:hypothetical protein